MSTTGDEERVEKGTVADPDASAEKCPHCDAPLTVNGVDHVVGCPVMLDGY